MEGFILSSVPNIFKSSNFNIEFSDAQHSNHNIYIILYMKLKGGSLKPPEIKMFLQASYEEKAPPQINDYMLDEKLSNLYGKVYVNESLKKCVRDWNGKFRN